MTKSKVAAVPRYTQLRALSRSEGTPVTPLTYLAELAGSSWRHPGELAAAAFCAAGTGILALWLRSLQDVQRGPDILAFVLLPAAAFLLFQAAVKKPWVHDLQHTSFLIGALVFWWALLEGRGGSRRQVAGVFYLFTTLVHTSVLGALLTFSTRVWYPVYEATAPAWGLAALEDQQLGGLIMWVPGGLVYMAAGLALLAALLTGRPGAQNGPAVPKGLP